MIPDAIVTASDRQLPPFFATPEGGLSLFAFSFQLGFFADVRGNCRNKPTILGFIPLGTVALGKPP
jgi:hypothetical protein